MGVLVGAVESAAPANRTSERLFAPLTLRKDIMVRWYKSQGTFDGFWSKTKDYRWTGHRPESGDGNIAIG